MLLLSFATVAASAQQDHTSSPFFGVVSHFLHNNQIYKDKDDTWLTSKTSPILEELGSDWVTEQIYALTNKSRALVDDGTLSASERRQVERRRELIDQWLAIHDRAGRKVLLAILAVAPKAKNSELINQRFAVWIAELVKRHPAIRVVQLHNEPNLRSFWSGSPEQYVDVYRPIAETIKAQNPHVEIAVGAISSLSWKSGRDWFSTAMSHGLLDFADAVTVHPYNLRVPPEIDPHMASVKNKDELPLTLAIQGFWKEVQGFNSKGRPLNLYFTELGYSSAPNGIAGIGDEVLQAKYLTRLMSIYVDVRVRYGIPLNGIFWYDFKNDGDDASNQEDNFGLVSRDLKRRKPAFEAYRNLIAVLTDVADLQPVGLRLEPAASNAVQVAWRRRSRPETIIPVWATGGSPTTIHLTLPPEDGVLPAEVTAIDLLSGEKTQIPVKEGTVSVSVSDYVKVLVARY